LITEENDGIKMETDKSEEGEGMSTSDIEEVHLRSGLSRASSRAGYKFLIFVPPVF
jgi:hypothetical protein